ncbi:uncharacterized protein LOC127263129 [Andrographis paniculata]|uniref:uncharacterized protein LOC127263129 n=1 Tax=Andrographis paniculata TaxID=175694 RepID=UPI0021E7E0B2|nr:uncharacterized protein LOC127263129 [Andrographis paniculata]
MDFFKQFTNAHKPNAKNVTTDQPTPQSVETKNGCADVLSKSINVDSTNAASEDDDDDFITNEVKRRLKELRRNSFMVLIPEETTPADEEEEEEEGGTSSNEWRDVEAEGRQFWSGFDAVYEIYCERMLFFDQSSAQLLLEAGSGVISSPSPRSGSKKLASPFRCISLRKFEEDGEEVQSLCYQVSDKYNDLETAYVAQVCLTWEALHSQYTQFSQKISCQAESPTSYNHSAQQFQQFQVLLQRFIENEPFEPGPRPQIYARARKSWPKLLQVPKIQASEEKSTGGEEAPNLLVAAMDLIRIIESSILSFHQFVKTDKTKSGVARHVFGNQNQLGTPVQLSLERKAGKLKELWNRSKSCNKKRSWPSTRQGAEVLLALVDVKVVRRAVQMPRISKEQLFWCEEKMKKLGLPEGKLQRDPSPILFPC